MANRSESTIRAVSIVVVLALAGIVFLLINRDTTVSVSEVPSSETSTTNVAAVPAMPDGPSVVIDDANISVELATTTAAVEKGLSDRLSLNPDSGMLFIFAKPAIYRFWMPDMHFPLDMIWINNGQVVDISRNVTTTFNPAAPIFYTPKTPAEDVLEVNAGFSAAHGIEPGDAITFKNIE
ncbi:MAG: DUF192 domain-containing protein [Minisyncoccia bacterium]